MIILHSEALLELLHCQISERIDAHLEIMSLAIVLINLSQVATEDFKSLVVISNLAI